MLEAVVNLVEVYDFDNYPAVTSKQLPEYIVMAQQNGCVLPSDWEGAPSVPVPADELNAMMVSAEELIEDRTQEDEAFRFLNVCSLQTYQDGQKLLDWLQESRNISPDPISFLEFINGRLDNLFSSAQDQRAARVLVAALQRNPSFLNYTGAADYGAMEFADRTVRGIADKGDRDDAMRALAALREERAFRASGQGVLTSGGQRELFQELCSALRVDTRDFGTLGDVVAALRTEMEELDLQEADEVDAENFLGRVEADVDGQLAVRGFMGLADTQLGPLLRRILKTTATQDAEYWTCREAGWELHQCERDGVLSTALIHERLTERPTLGRELSGTHAL